MSVAGVSPVAGVIVPSSNTVMEPVLARIREDRGDALVLVHSRVRVTVIDDDETTSSQFAGSPMAVAAGLLADAHPEGIVWGGTSGSWLGPEADRGIVDEIGRTTGLRATTTTLAIVEMLRELGVDRVGVATPYVPVICSRIEDVYRGYGFTEVRSLGAGLTENHAFASVGTPTLVEQAERLVAAGAEAVVVACTNVDGLGTVEPVRAAGAVVVDSNVATYWAAARFAGVPLISGSRWLPEQGEEKQ